MRIEYSVGLWLLVSLGCSRPSADSSVQSAIEISTGTTAADRASLGAEIGERVRAARAAESESRFVDAVALWKELRAQLADHHGVESWRVANCDRAILDDERLCQLGPNEQTTLDQLRNLERRTAKHVQNGSLRDAQACIRQARPLALQLLGESNAVSLRLQMMAGEIAAQMEDWEAALQELEQASVLARQLWLAPHPDLEYIEYQLGISARQAGQLDRSIQHLDQALHMTESLDGRRAAFAARANELGVSLHRAARFDEAMSQFQTSEQIRRAALGDENPLVAESLLNQAIVLSDQKQWEAAGAKLAAAEKVRAVNPLPPHLQEEIWLRRATISATQRDFSGAADDLQLALDSIERRMGRFNSRYAHVAYRLAMCDSFQSKFDSAEPLFRHALSVQSSMLGSGDAETRKTANALAALLQRTDRPAEAQALLRQTAYTAGTASEVETQ